MRANHVRLAGKYLLFHNEDYVTLEGTGYVQLRWEVEYWKYGLVARPSACSV